MGGVSVKRRALSRVTVEVEEPERPMDNWERTFGDPFSAAFKTERKLRPQGRSMKLRAPTIAEGDERGASEGPAPEVTALKRALQEQAARRAAQQLPPALVPAGPYAGAQPWYQSQEEMAHQAAQQALVAETVVQLAGQAEMMLQNIKVGCGCACGG